MEIIILSVPIPWFYIFVSKNVLGHSLITNIVLSLDTY